MQLAGLAGQDSWKIELCNIKLETELKGKTDQAQTVKFAVIDGNLAFVDDQEMYLIIVKLNSGFSNQWSCTSRWWLNSSWFPFIPSINAPDAQLWHSPCCHSRLTQFPSEGFKRSYSEMKALILVEWNEHYGSIKVDSTYVVDNEAFSRWQERN